MVHVYEVCINIFSVCNVYLNDAIKKCGIVIVVFLWSQLDKFLWPLQVPTSFFASFWLLIVILTWAVNNVFLLLAHWSYIPTLVSVLVQMASESGKIHLGLLGFWTSSIIWYSNRAGEHFVNWIFLSSSGLTGRTNLSHWMIVNFLSWTQETVPAFWCPIFHQYQIPCMHICYLVVVKDEFSYNIVELPNQALVAS